MEEALSFLIVENVNQHLETFVDGRHPIDDEHIRQLCHI